MERDLETAAAELERELTQWRVSNRAPARIPADLWAKAVELAAHLGVHKTSKALGLGYASLKKRMSLTLSAAERPGATFFEWLPPMGANIGECSLTIESARGATMRMTMKDVPPISMAQILRDFAG